MHDLASCTTHPLYNPARQGNWPYSLTHSLRTLYVKTDIQVEKALGLIFERSATMYTRHISLQIIQGNSCWMYLEIRIFLVTSTTGRAFSVNVNPLNPELNPICYLLALLGAHNFLHVSRIRVKLLTFRLLMSYIYIYGAPILDVSRSHTTTQHSR